MSCYLLLHRIAHCILLIQQFPSEAWTHHVVEDEAAVREFEVFEEAIEFLAVQRAPRAVQVITGLCLLPRVIVIQKLL